jgi:hypothetical protein
MILQDAIKCIELRVPGTRGFRHYGCGGGDLRRTRTHEFAVYFNQAGIARLYGTKLRVVADMRYISSALLDHID